MQVVIVKMMNCHVVWVLASCLIYAWARLECVIIIMWLRSVLLSRCYGP